MTPLYERKVRQRHARVFFLFLFFNMFFSCVSTTHPHTQNRYKEYAEKLRPLVKDTVLYLHKALESGRSVLVEGANAAMLDIDFGAKISNAVLPSKISLILH